MPPRVERYLAEAARAHGVPVSRMLVKRCRGNLWTARKEVMNRLRWHDGFSNPQIASWLGLNHTTVLHATRLRDDRNIDFAREVRLTLISGE